MVCPHAARRQETAPLIPTIKVDVDDILIPIAHLCQECLAKWPVLQDESEKEEFLATLVPVCGKCFDEI